jgi:hypothetical protein
LANENKKTLRIYLERDYYVIVLTRRVAFINNDFRANFRLFGC